MSVSFTLTSKTRVDTFKSRASIQDVMQHAFDCAAWEGDNAAITSATWTVESGNASISNQAVASGLVTADITFAASGKVLISILLNTAGAAKKKLWLEVRVKDLQYETDDYGICS